MTNRYGMSEYESNNQSYLPLNFENLLHFTFFYTQASTNNNQLAPNFVKINL